MNILFDTIHALNKEEIRNFKLYVNRLDYGSDRKDLQLFDMIKKSNPESIDDQIICNKLDIQNKNNYYFLKHRLQDEINKSLLNLHIDNKINNEILYHLFLYNIYYAKNKYSICYIHLSKAEKIALKNESYDMLENIYSELIKLSLDYFEIDPYSVQVKRNQNLDLLNALREIDQLQAMLHFNLRKHQNFAAKDKSLLSKLEKKISQVESNALLQNIRSVKTKIYKSVSQVLLQHKNYKDLEAYVQKTFLFFQSKNWFLKDNHELKIQMLIYIINSKLAIKKDEKILEVCAELKKALEEHEHIFYDKYIFYYYQGLTLYYQNKDWNRVVTTLTGLEQSQLPGLSSQYHKFFITLNLCISYFNLGSFKKSNLYIEKLFKLDIYKKLDTGIQLKASVLKILISYEFEFENLELQAIKKIKKTFQKILNKKDFKNDNLILNMVEKIVKEENYLQSKYLKTLYSNTLEALEVVDNSESQLLNYATWLDAKTKSI